MDRNLDVEQAERIAVLESKVDNILGELKEVTGLLRPMIALYQAGKFVMAISGTFLTYVHWDQVQAFLSQLFLTHKH